MEARTAFVLASLGLAFALVAGCNGILGIDPPHVISSGAGGDATSGPGSGGKSGGSSSRGAGASTSASSNGTGGGGPEDCTNGVDDNGNGLADCADPACASYACLAAPPQMARYAVEVVSAADCPAPLTAMTLSECATCSCNSTPPNCPSIVEYFTNAACTSGGAMYQLQASNGCTTVSPSSYARLALGLTGGDCNPAQPTVGSIDHTYCVATAVGACPGSAGDVCVPPAPSGAFNCLLVDGDVTCPMGFGAKTAVFSGGSGTCDCACDVNQASCTGGDVELRSGSNCTGSTISLPIGGCTASNGDGWLVVANDPTGATTCRNAASISGGTRKTLCCQ